MALRSMTNAAWSLGERVTTRLRWLDDPQLPWAPLAAVLPAGALYIGLGLAWSR